MSSTTLLYATAARARRKAAFAAVSSEVVTDFLALAERRVEKRCDREFNYEQRTEYHTGRNRSYFFVRAHPIESLDALVVIDANGDEDTIDVSGSDADVVYDAESGKISFGPKNTSSYGVFPITYPENVKLTYTAGWNGVANVPDDFQEAVILQAMILYAQTSLHMAAGLQSQKVGQGAKQRIGTDVYREWTLALESLLEPYIRMEV